MVRDGHPSVLAKGLGADPHTWRHLTPFVLGLVHEPDDAGHGGRVETLGDKVGGGAVAFDVAGQDGIELGIGRERLVVALIGSQLGGRGFERTASGMSALPALSFR